MRVLLIARYLQMVNHRKVMALAAQSDIELWHIAPRQWTDGFRTYHQVLDQGQGYHFQTVDTLPRNKNDIHRFIYWPPTLRLQQIKPDIIHIEEEPDSLAALEVVLARRILAPKARLALFTWQNLVRPRKRLVETMARFVLNEVDFVIAGNAEAVEVTQRLGYSGPSAVLPQLGVDTTLFSPTSTTDPRSQFNISGFTAGYIGRLIPEKGIETLIEAAAQVEDCRLLIVGAGPLESDLQQIAHSVGFEDRLSVVNSIPHEAVPDYLRAIDVLVLPSRTTPHWKEQFGHILIEAMACGTPVIGSDSGAIPEVVGDAGLIFPEGDVPALTNYLRTLSQDQTQIERLEQLGLARVQALYTHEQIAQKTVEIYRTILSSPRKRVNG